MNSHELQDTLTSITSIETEWKAKARSRLDDLAIPRGSLGRLLGLAEQLAAIKRSLAPSVTRKTIVTMAGDHGVTAEGVSAFPSEVTPQMVRNFVAGGAAINILAGVAGADVKVVDMGVAGDLSDLAANKGFISRRIAPGTCNMAAGPAMTRGQAIRALEAGMGIAADLAAEGVELLGTGDMGIGNTTPSTALLAVFTGLALTEITGRGTGLDDQSLSNKVKVIERAITVNRPDADDPVDVLAKVGGFEIGGIAGLILGAAGHRIPVVIDGLISSAGALIAARLCPAATGYMIAAHRSMEPGHRRMLEAMGLEPVLDLNLRLGEGTGAALAMPVVEAASRIIRRMLTFSDAGVSGPSVGEGKLT